MMREKILQGFQYLLGKLKHRSGRKTVIPHYRMDNDRISTKDMQTNADNLKDDYEVGTGVSLIRRKQKKRKVFSVTATGFEVNNMESSSTTG